MTLAYAVCVVPVAPLRSEASHRSEQVSQLLFGEKVQIIEVNLQQWAKVIVLADDYVGWVKMGQFKTIEFKQFKKAAKYFTLGNEAVLKGQYGTTLLSPGSELFLMHKQSFDWCPNVKFKGKKTNSKLITPELIESYIKSFTCQFIGAPYLWGGRSIMGIDCSGFVQVVFKLLNITLPRDAYQQAGCGQHIDFLQAAQLGDLAFFDNEEGRINHVGILLDNHTIIHATEFSGGVVVDSIDNGGIISSLHRKRTHYLRLIKRLV